jgi:ketosteroid isomerase-like protein
VVQYEFLRFDTSDLMTETNRAAIEIPLQYRHRETGTLLETTKANFWTLEEGWPVKLTEYYDIAHIQAFAASVAPRAPV